MVGPSLGADSIRRGVTAGLVGLALVIASMMLYYRGAGWNAVLALLLNTIITIAALSYIDATWTLPGIAGWCSRSAWRWIPTCSSSSASRRSCAPASWRPAPCVGVRPGVRHDYRYPRHYGGGQRVPVHVRHRAGARLRRDAGHRSGSEPVHGGVRFASLFDPALAQARSGEAQHLAAAPDRDCSVPPTFAFSISAA